MGPHPAVAAVRHAVRLHLSRLSQDRLSPDRLSPDHTSPDHTGPPGLVLVACSGGADSLALAAALAFEAPRLGLRAGGVTVDHGLQPESAGQAARVTATMRELGLDPVHSVKADVATRASARYPGPEAAARQARYAAIDAVTAQAGAVAVLLGHTMDDQAETVLLRLARGSGARSLAGMAAASGAYLRPLLGIRREQTRAACLAAGLEPWDDPQNADPAFTRTAVREAILPLMEELLGPGVARALARTADLLRADADALEDLAADAAARLMGDWEPPPGSGRTAQAAIDVAELVAMPAAIRTRLLRRAAIAAGAPAGSLTAGHVAQLDALVTGWRGQRWVDLPGRLRCQRRCGRLHFTTR